MIESLLSYQNSSDLDRQEAKAEFLNLFCSKNGWKPKTSEEFSKYTDDHRTIGDRMKLLGI